MISDKYRTLRPTNIVDAIARLRQRITERFPNAGLGEVAGELQYVAGQAAVRAETISQPIRWLRNIIAGLLIGVVVLVAIVARQLRVRADLGEVVNLVQFIEAAIGSAVFIGVAVLFLMSLEIRLKRRKALAAIHELRAIAHVVDMHQITKDPEGLLRRGPMKSREPQQTTKTLFELNRYLNYCNEMLAIISKIAAVYVQEFPDAPTVSAVDQVENLCSGLSQRIWQKINVFEDTLDESMFKESDERRTSTQMKSEPPALAGGEQFQGPTHD